MMIVMWRDASLVIRIGSLVGFTILLVVGRGSADSRWEAVLTEITHGQGGVFVTRAGQSLPFPAEPLTALKTDDTVIARADARAVLLFQGGTTTTVTVASSPMTVRAPSADTPPGLRQTIGRLFSVLGGASIPPVYVSLGARVQAGAEGPVMLLRYLPGSVVFDWRAPALGAAHEAQIAGDDGLKWSQQSVVPPLAYPTDAPQLTPGVFYEFIVKSASGKLVEHRFFEVVPDAERETIQAELTALESSPAPPATKALMRGCYLAAARILPEARRGLEAAVNARPAEPSLRLFLAKIYESLGRSDLADAQLDLVRALSRPAER